MKFCKSDLLPDVPLKLNSFISTPRALAHTFHARQDEEAGLSHVLRLTNEPMRGGDEDQLTLCSSCVGRCGSALTLMKRSQATPTSSTDQATDFNRHTVKVCHLLC